MDKTTFANFPSSDNFDVDTQYLVGFSDKKSSKPMQERKFKLKSIYFNEKGVFLYGVKTNKWYKLIIDGEEDEEYIWFSKGVSNPDNYTDET